MKRGAKICVLALFALVLTAVLTFLMTHVAIVSVTTAVPSGNLRAAAGGSNYPARRMLVVDAQARQDEGCRHHNEIQTEVNPSASSSSGGEVRCRGERHREQQQQQQQQQDEPAKVHDRDQHEWVAVPEDEEHEWVKVHAHEQIDQSQTDGTTNEANARLGSEGSDPRCEVFQSMEPACIPETDAIWNMSRAAQAVGHMTVDGQSCSGVLLGNATDAFFLTAARCLPSEAAVTAASIEFKNCSTSVALADCSVFHLNRRLNFVVLRLNTRGVEIANDGFLQIRPGVEPRDEVYVPHYRGDRAEYIADTSGIGQGSIQVRAFEEIDQCPTKYAYTRVTYVGAPLLSVRDNAVVALHLCGSCDTRSVNSALTARAIVDDLDAGGRLLPSFVAAA